jgi:predicted transcriptional regulator
MADSTTLRLDPALKERLEALAAGRGMDPGELLAELIAEAETAQLVAQVNAELERLTQGPATPGRRSAEMRELEATVRGWMQD